MTKSRKACGLWVAGLWVGSDWRSVVAPGSSQWVADGEVCGDGGGEGAMCGAAWVWRVLAGRLPFTGGSPQASSCGCGVGAVLCGSSLEGSRRSRWSRRVAVALPERVAKGMGRVMSWHWVGPALISRLRVLGRREPPRSIGRRDATLCAGSPSS